MARIQLDLPSKFLFSTDIAIRVSDLNYGNHVGNDSILTLMQEARTQFYRSLGFASEISIDGSVGQIIVDASVVYKTESFLGDTLSIQIGVTEVNKYGFDMYYQLTNKATGLEVARGKTGIVCFDFIKRKVASIPSLLLTKLS